MINSNKRWLLTASPWMKRSSRLTPFGIGGIFLCALLFLSSLRAGAQIHPTTTKMDYTRATSTYSNSFSRFLPAITTSRGTTICQGNIDSMMNSVGGGTWSSSNTAVGTIDPASGILTALSGGSTLITYTVGTASNTILIMVTSPISAATYSVCVGNSLALTDATPTGLWTSSNTGVATVDVYGNVTGLSAGTTTISYGVVGACQVTQTVNVGPNSIAPITGTVTGALAVCQSSTTTLSDATPSGTWSSSNTAVASFVGTTGVVNGVAAGAATVTYSVGGCYITRAISVTSPSTLAAVTGASTVCVGDTIMLADATTSGIWSSANTAVAIVNASGVINALTAGTATINYYKMGCTVTKTVTVNANTISPVSGSVYVCIGQTSQLTDVTTPGTWSVSDVTLASIGSTGIVTGVAAGNPVVTYSSGGCYITVGLTVSNSSVVVGAITGSVSLCQGSSITLSDGVTGGTWSASNGSATINAYGIVTGVTAANVYNGIDTMIYTRMGCSVTQIITVNPLPAAITGRTRECINGGTTTLSSTTPGGTWTSSNTSVSTVVGSTGVVTGVATSGLGTAYDTIRYTLPTGCYVIVPDTAFGPANIIGGHQACVATMTYLELNDPTPGGTWSSSTPTIGSLGTLYGSVVGVSAGTTTISYNVTYTGITPLTCSALNVVTVSVSPSPITGNTSVCASGTTTLSDLTAGGTWSSNNTALATIGTSGIVTGVAAGGVVVSYSLNGCSVTANVSISTPPAPITASSFNVCQSLGTITVNDATTGGTWSASNAYINIAQTGSTTALVTGISSGASATITYTLGACIATQIVSVIANTAGTITGQTNTLCTGATQTITDVAVGGAWSSSNSAVVAATGTTNSIAVSAVAAGTAVVSYTVANGCFKIWTYTVDRSPSAIYKLVPGIINLCGDSTITLFDTTVGGTWSTSNPHIATISSTGTVTAVTAGHATISYSMPGGCVAYLPVAVSNNPGAIQGSIALCSVGVNTVTLVDSLGGGTWASSNTSVGTVGSTTGIVTAGATAGTTTITYTVGTCFVTKVMSVGISNPTITASLTPVCALGVASASLVAGTDYSPAGGKWTSANALIASINGTTGAVTGIGAGTVLMTYTALNSGCFATVNATVFADTLPRITGGSAMCYSSTLQLADSVTGGTWASTTVGVATIGSASGLLTSTALGGYTTITYTAPGAGACKQWLTMTVGTTYPAAITPTANAICAGATAGVNLIETTTGGAWTVDNSTVAVVNSLGGVDGLTVGTATVYYTLNGCAASTVVTVNPLPAPITGTLLECQGSTTTLSDITGGGTWSTTSTNASVVGSTGVVTAATGTHYGTANITYTLPTGCYVTAVDTVASTGSLTVSPTASGSICNGATATMTVTPTPSPAGFWSSSNAGIASVNTAGIVIGIAGGTATITFATYGNCATTNTVVTVNYLAPITNNPGSVCITDASIVLTDTTSGGTWTSSANTIVSVGSTTGQITGVAAGVATISYSQTFGAHTCIATTSISAESCAGRSANSTTGIATEASQQVYTLFPNPSNGNITITQRIANDEPMQVAVVNQLGATIYTASMNFTSGKAQMDLNNVTPGIYLVLLQDQHGATQTFKVLIEK